MSQAEPTQNPSQNQNGRSHANGAAQACRAPNEDRRAPHIEALFQLSLSGERSASLAHLAGLDSAGREEFLRVAQAHHVVIRGLQPAYEHATANGLADLAAWSEQALAAERARVNNALDFLNRICNELESAGCPVVVIKTLDHVPDLGSDLDLYTSAQPERLIRVMTTRFPAKLEPRSWGDRLAGKRNFSISGLPELVEVHAQRLGQTGEHTALAQRFIARRTQKQIQGSTFFVPAPEERILVSVLQRMYRHFYFRICDVVDSAAIVDSGKLDFAELEASTEPAGVWPGVATYLQIVSDYVQRYRGAPLPLPPAVRSAALFGAERMNIRAGFLRVPVLPEGAGLFTRQVTKTALAGDVPATLRLNLLPPLAAAAFVAYKVTGSDKGIW